MRGGHSQDLHNCINRTLQVSMKYSFTEHVLYPFIPILEFLSSVGALYHLQTRLRSLNSFICALICKGLYMILLQLPFYPRGLPFSTYAPSGVGRVKTPIHFHCVLHAKRGVGVQIACNIAYALNGRPRLTFLPKLPSANVYL